MRTLQCVNDMNERCMLKRYSFCWAFHAKWYPSVRIDEENEVKHDLGNRFYGGQGQNKIGGAHIRHVDSTMCK